MCHFQNISAPKIQTSQMFHFFILNIEKCSVFKTETPRKCKHLNCSIFFNIKYSEMFRFQNTTGCPISYKTTGCPTLQNYKVSHLKKLQGVPSYKTAGCPHLTNYRVSHHKLQCPISYKTTRCPIYQNYRFNLLKVEVWSLKITVCTISFKLQSIPSLKITSSLIC